MAEPTENTLVAMPISWQCERIPYLAEYMGLWMYEADRFLLGVKHAQTMNIAQHVQDERVAKQEARRNGLDAKQETANQNVRRGYSYEITDGIATVQLSGTLMKHVSSFDESTSTVMLRNTMRQMQRDPNVKAVILVIDSPGGTVSGAYDLADDVKSLAKAKPTYAYAEDLCASGAYLQASQCVSISANQNALIGSIGTYGAIYDYSKLFEKEGVKAILISSGGMKGLGTPGLEISQEQIDYLTKIVKQQNDLFVKYVADGRELAKDKVESLADGRVHLSQDALRLGLIDKVESADALFNRVWKEVNPSATSRGSSRQTTSAITMTDYQDKKIRDTISSREDQINEPKQESAAEAGASSEGANVATSDEPGAQADSTGGDAMSQAKDNPAPGAKVAEEPKPASIKELRQAFADDSDFALDCAEKALTMIEAKAAYGEKMITKNKELAAENAKLKEAAKETPKDTKVGVPGIPSQTGTASTSVVEGDGALAELEQRIEPLVKAGKTRQQAIQKVFSDDDEFRQQYVKEMNAAKAA